MSRRDFLRYGTMVTAGAALSGYLSACRLLPGANGADLTFWSQEYGDPAEWLQMYRGLAAEFAEETDFEVTPELQSWDVAFTQWLLVTQGGEAPDIGDQFWLYSHSQLGGDEHGPRPITEFQQEYFPDLRDRFFEGALDDVFWEDEFYGIPWRGDIRPLLYRVDLLEAAGFDRPPDTWEEVSEYARALTDRDAGIYGWDFGTANPAQNMMPYLWQAGGSYMTDDGRQATVDTPEMRESLQWMRSLVEDEVVHPDFMEAGYDAGELLTAGRLAMAGSMPSAEATDIARDFPELEGQWALALPAQGPANRAAYSGAGYFGVLRGASDVEAAVEWLAFLARTENLQLLSETSGHVSPSIDVMESDFWQDTEWKRVLNETLEHARTSQHPTAAWGGMAAPESGAVIYDLYYDVLVRGTPMDDAIEEAQQRMQAELDRDLEEFVEDLEEDED
jgi:multiple sugar transport system substrate-binding protein